MLFSVDPVEDLVTVVMLKHIPLRQNLPAFERLTDLVYQAVVK